jgi:hypothetical protein
MLARVHSSAVVIYSGGTTTLHMVNNSEFKRNFYVVHVGVAAVKTLNNKESMTRYHIPSLAQFNIAMNFKNKMADCVSNTPKGHAVLEFTNNLGGLGTE